VEFFCRCKAKQNKVEKTEEEDDEECAFSALRDDFYANCQQIEVIYILVCSDIKKSF
jgi:hypothetical protein